MNILITGGGGFLGGRLARASLARGELGGAAISRITLLDGAFPVPPPRDARVEAVTGDISDPQVVKRVAGPETDAVFHLAAVVSGAAEADFDLGMRVNLDGGRLLLENLRLCRKPPRFVFASSVAAFGGALPPVIEDTTPPAPQTSYGTQKVIGEFLINDYSRKGFIDGRSLRLPTIAVRSGKPNAAASSFASGILREPLNGLISDCPVGPETSVWLLSPRLAVEAFIHALELPGAALGNQRTINLPGITATVGEMLEALTRVAGAETAARVHWKPDARTQAIIGNWPTRFHTARALALGFRADRDIESIIRDYIADEQIPL